MDRINKCEEHFARLLMSENLSDKERESLQVITANFIGVHGDLGDLKRAYSTYKTRAQTMFTINGIAFGIIAIFFALLLQRPWG